ncbi:hypothetical protein GE107_09375 [Cohnella sp. CFH 77786]|uniref:hypothetical protein n=1 Tax=Cohnella sp. CFH 77786 TaxID=2662265 RepID=UPI001C60A526|nr:hypothetical protein [Cohnella sp. CFH 77786]MBW5446268.1 hypothetical protein [Cohnella sp. CFH 77786]
MKTIGCFHAHHSNIELIERALSAYEVELVHFVDPGLDRIKKDADFTRETVEMKVKGTLAWIARCHVDAVLVTCTFFTAALQGEEKAGGIPLFQIDEPLFEFISGTERPVIVAFTNPDTVQGTMEQLSAYLRRKGREVEAAPCLLENTFPLIMQGKKSEYTKHVTEGLARLVREHPGKAVAAAQLSMVPAARQAGKETGVPVANPLDSLAARMEEELALVRKDKPESMG